jgi:uncharacterized membrane protein
MMPAARSTTQRAAARGAFAAWIALIVLAVLWEWQLAPLRTGGSWLVLKAVPLLAPLRGVWRADAYAMQWALLLVLLYLCEGLVRSFEPAPVRPLALAEAALSLLFFVAAIVYLRPLKRAARQRQRHDAD